MASAGCAMPPPVAAPPAAGGATLLPRIVDERGELDAVQARAALRRLEEEGGDGLLAVHLADVNGRIPSPLVLGNDAHLLIDGPKTHAAMFEAIAAARRSVHLQTYILEAEETGQRLARLLEEGRARGVDVKVLYDSVGSISTPPEYFERLKAAGIGVCEFNPINPLKAEAGWQLNNRGHRKILVVDGKVAFTGGINISGVYSAGSFGSKRKAPAREEGWRDTHVQAKGPVVGEFQRLFLESWQRQGCGPESDVSDDAFPRQPRAGSQAMRVVAADPQAGESEPYLALLSAISHARTRAWLTYGYFVPDPRTLEALREAAQRGVDVRLMLPGLSDFWAPLYAGRSHYGALLEAGIRIFERRDALLHAKTAVIDGVWSSVGSTNLDWRSFVHNYEADLLVLDAGFAGEMEALFQLDQKASHEVSGEEWRRRGVKPRMLEWFARAWAYLL